MLSLRHSPRRLRDRVSCGARRRSVSRKDHPLHRAVSAGRRDRRRDARRRAEAERDAGSGRSSSSTIAAARAACSAPRPRRARAPDGYTLVMGTTGTHAINASLYAKPSYDPAEGFRRDHAGRAAAEHDRRASFGAGEERERADRARARETGRGVVRLVRQLPLPERRALHDDGEHRHAARAFQGRRAGDAGGDRGRGRDVVRDDRVVSAARRQREAARARRHERAALSFDARRCRRSPSPGLPGYEAVAWYGVFAPDGTPREIVTRLNTEIVRIVRSPDVRELFLKQGAESFATSPAEFTKIVRQDVAKWAKVVKASGAKPD